MTDIRTSPEELKQLVVNRLTEANLRQSHAEAVADVLVHADQRGVSSHGVLRTEHYVKRLTEGGINPEANYSVEETGPCSAVFDGDDGMGHAITKEAMKKAIEMAKTNGIAMVSVVNSSHCGALSYFVEQAAEENLVGMAMTHTDNIVVPFGAKDPYFGTNPIAYGFPTGKNKPVILDMATSNVAFGKVLHAREAGTEIPDNWGVDKEGRPTTDPHQVSALMPFAGPKGYGMGMMVDVMSGILTGSAFGPGITKMYGDYSKKRKLGHFLIVIDPGMFTDKEEFLTNMDQMIDEIHGMEPAEGFDRVLVPGEPEQLKEEAALRDGVPVTKSVYEYLAD
ncbi:ureidoglycolate dehydrogenase [Alteribacter natronophilus]|uniref:ureidoglycolate dehydrogenase n=1 Tax=Alteribacter natronophilus TaxID=2583810 RepID=UPI00110E996F|nr:ureidoglycolate dehydrogenase [Alteribacter natronophilus]TMW72289.1 ureidoglycolate dehydrogenase [Alteribacter natronophilus]